LLKETERNKGAAGIGKSAVPKQDGTPITLSELGITKKESSNAQFLAELPNEEFEKVKLGKKKISVLKREHKREAGNDSGTVGEYASTQTR